MLLAAHGLHEGVSLNEGVKALYSIKLVIILKSMH